MKARALGVLIGALAFASAPAGAGHEVDHRESVVFQAPVPCMGVCSVENPCRTEPTPTPSWDDEQVSVPAGAATLVFEFFSFANWDSFVCSSDGRTLARGVDPYEDLCDNLLGQNSPVPFGCRERSLVRVAEGQTLTLRGINFGDALDAGGTYVFRAAHSGGK